MPDVAAPLNQIAGWQARARSAAEGHDHHATKRAVEEVRMAQAERNAAHRLFEQHFGLITRICEVAHAKSQRAPDAPPVSTEDVKQASWELFLRCLVRFDPEQGSLDTYLKHALRSRVTDWLRSKSADRVETKDTAPDRSTRQSAAGAVGISFQTIVSRMIEGDPELEDQWQALVA